ncbi:hypothetical protein OSB04_029429 [Centaurea solstitialis]|uniref:Cytochrome P450 n=1 Tax=Centaurea solstitialis TaxID=347529 RepID=A0AA38SID2_9ASTR|nr:hypothetical protein OSB04_029429 [Centaurea solstitialis]
MISQLGEKLYLTILIISIPTLLLLLWYRGTSKGSKPPLPPGPYGLPIVGYLPFLKPNLHLTFTNMAHRYGPIFSLWLGSKLHVVVNTADLAKVVVRDMDQNFANRDPPLTGLTISYGGLDVVFSNHKHWRDMRKLLASQVLSNANLHATRSLRTNGVRKMLRDVHGRIGTEININKVAYDTEIDVVTEMLWGCSKGYDDYGGVGDEFQEVALETIRLFAAANISDIIPMLSRFDLQGRERDIRKCKEHLDRIFENIIRGRINANSRKMDKDERKDFLQVLLDEKDDPTSSIDINQIKAILVDVILGTIDTTSTMVEWVMTEVLYNPRVMTKIQKELGDVIGPNNIVEESHLSNLTYLDAVIKETLRLLPAGPLLLPRCPDESCTVGGYTIPKGSIVYVNAWAIHRDPKNWTNPLEFNPERFLNTKWDYQGNNLKFLPFGSGRRKCPGAILGEKMVMYLVASLLHSFDWSLTKDEDFDLSQEFDIAMRKKKQLIVIPTPRLSDASLYL